MPVYDVYYNVGRYDTNAYVHAKNKREAKSIMRKFMESDDLVAHYEEEAGDYSGLGVCKHVCEVHPVDMQALIEDTGFGDDGCGLENDYNKARDGGPGTVIVYSQGT